MIYSINLTRISKEILLRHRAHRDIPDIRGDHWAGKKFIGRERIWKLTLAVEQESGAVAVVCSVVTIKREDYFWREATIFSFLY
jgi:hypothetical protein